MTKLTAEQRALLKRVNAARALAFPHSTTPACRHAAMIGEYLLRNKPYTMLTDEPEHCGESILLAVAMLWEAKAAAHTIHSDHPLRHYDRTCHACSPPDLSAIHSPGVGGSGGGKEPGSDGVMEGGNGR